MGTPLKVYVAGAWIEKKSRAEVQIQRLREKAVRITWDWTVDEIPAVGGELGGVLPDYVRFERAQFDLGGVRAADVVWLLAPNERGASGAWTELGVALGLGKTVYVSGAKHDRSIFTALAARCFSTDEEALEYVLALHRSQMEF